ncbi:MAG: hypothetical protein AABZ60_15105 [Planctomycetota bacterium]
MKCLICFLILFILGTIFLPCFAEDKVDKLVFNDGKEVTGSIEEETDKYVKFKDKFGSRKYPKKDIKEIVRGDTSGSNTGGGGEEKNNAGSEKITKPTKVEMTTEIEGKMGLTLNKMKTQHFLMMSEFDDAANSDYLLLWEKVYDDFCKFWKTDPETFFSEPCQVIVFSSEETFRRFVDKFVIREQMTMAERELYQHISGVRLGELQYSSYKDEERMPSHEDYKPGTLHTIAHILMNQYKQTEGDLPAWVKEGFACYTEFKYFKKAGSVSCVTSGSRTGRTLDEGWEHGEDWQDLLKETLENEELANFSILLNIDLNSMTFRELAHAWSMNTFLIDTYPDKFRMMMDLFKERGKKEQIPILKESYEWAPKDFEKEWQKYLKRKK